MEEFGVDYLVVSVGSISGQFDIYLIFDFEWLQQICDKVDVFLVFYGGMGIFEDQLWDVIRIGVVKVNIVYGF